MATLMNKPKADLTPEELEEREKHEFQDSDRILTTKFIKLEFKLKATLGFVKLVRV